MGSEIIARAHEGLTSFIAEETDAFVLQRFAEMDRELGLLALLRGLNAVDSVVSANRNVILIFGEMLEVRSFANANDAIQELFVLEKDNPGKDIVLVRADTSDDVRNAFRNYFSDAREFIDLIEAGRRFLSSRLPETAL